MALLCVRSARVLVPLIVSLTAMATAGCGPSGGTSHRAPSVGDHSEETVPLNHSAGSNSSNSTIGKNQMPVTVDGTLCGGSSSQRLNQACVEVTVCTVGTSHCQNISNLLLDTGSTGLRVFASVLSVATTPVLTGGGVLAECQSFADGSSEWGPVVYAEVQLASEPAVKVAIQTINSKYATPPAPCSTPQSRPDVDPAHSGFNGILGLGLFTEDCGTSCTSASPHSPYFSCVGATCTPSATTVQVQNPVALLPSDNNGIIVTLPAVASAGQANASGTVTLGICTQPNNTPTSGVTPLATTERGTFSATLKSVQAAPLVSYIDSGSNVLAFPAPSDLPSCEAALVGPDGETLAGLFCPAASESFTVSVASATGSSQTNVSFAVGNAAVLAQNKTNFVYADVAAASSPASPSFDWGLPFFFGKSVYVGIAGTKSSLGLGPYFGF